MRKILYILYSEFYCAELMRYAFLQFAAFSEAYYICFGSGYRCAAYVSFY